MASAGWIQSYDNVKGKMIKEILIGLSCLATGGIYYPMWKRMIERKHTRDFSRTSQWFICGVQVNNLFLAISENAPYLTAWYILQSVLTFTSLVMIYKFWDFEEPRLRKRKK